jgi:hypothetical protein
VYKYFVLKTHVEENNKTLQTSFVPFEISVVVNLYKKILAHVNNEIPNKSEGVVHSED